MNNELINFREFVKIAVTGQLYRSHKRFKRFYTVDNAGFAFCINLWRGSVWGVREDGSRKLLKRVIN